MEPISLPFENELVELRLRSQIATKNSTSQLVDAIANTFQSQLQH